MCMCIVCACVCMCVCACLSVSARASAPVCACAREFYLCISDIEYDPIRVIFNAKNSFAACHEANFFTYVSWWVLQHCTGFARLVWGRLRVHRPFVYSDWFVCYVCFCSLHTCAQLLLRILQIWINVNLHYSSCQIYFPCFQPAFFFGREFVTTESHVTLDSSVWSERFICATCLHHLCNKWCKWCTNDADMLHKWHMSASFDAHLCIIWCTKSHLIHLCNMSHLIHLCNMSACLSRLCDKT